MIFLSKKTSDAVAKLCGNRSGTTGSHEEHREFLLALIFYWLRERGDRPVLRLYEANLCKLLPKLRTVEPMVMYDIRHIGRMESSAAGCTMPYLRATSIFRSAITGKVTSTFSIPLYLIFSLIVRSHAMWLKLLSMPYQEFLVFEKP